MARILDEAKKLARNWCKKHHAELPDTSLFPEVEEGVTVAGGITVVAVVALDEATQALGGNDIVLRDINVDALASVLTALHKRETQVREAREYQEAEKKRLQRFICCWNGGDGPVYISGQRGKRFTYSKDRTKAVPIIRYHAERWQSIEPNRTIEPVESEVDHG